MCVFVYFLPPFCHPGTEVELLRQSSIETENNKLLSLLTIISIILASSFLVSCHLFFY